MHDGPPRGPWSGPGRGSWSGHGRRGPGRGFGCLFGLVFLLIAGSLVAAAGFVVSSLGWVGPVVLILVGLGLARLGIMLRRSAATLDDLVEATERVRAGDYAVRVAVPDRSPRPVRSLVAGFDTMVRRLEADEEQRRSLLADVSHELRTPLTVIAGELEAMIDGVRPTDAAHLEAILDETAVMARLVEDLRTVALSEAGTLALHPEPIDPDVLIDEVVRSFATPAAAAGLTVTAEVPDDLPIIDVDPVRLREILSNLVSNAIRHTPAQGTIVVRGHATGSHLVIEVADTGPGIDPRILPHVFDRFAKGDGSTGSGLGLAIARNLATAHGGTLVVADTGSAGTTFRLELPLEMS